MGPEGNHARVALPRVLSDVGDVVAVVGAPLAGQRPADGIQEVAEPGAAALKVCHSASAEPQTRSCLIADTDRPRTRAQAPEIQAASPGTTAAALRRGGP